MDMCASSASLLEEELASAMEPAVKAAVLSVMSALAKFVDSKCAVFHLRLDERDQEFESVRLRLEIAESELKAMRDGEYTNTGDKNFTQSLTNTSEQYCGLDMDILHVPELQQEEHRLDHTRTAEWIIAHGLPARDFTTLPVQPTRDPVPAVQTALKNSRVLIQEDGSYSEQDLLMRGDDSEQRDHTSTAGWRRALKGKEIIFQSISSNCSVHTTLTRKEGGKE
ncbi:zinc finger protein 19-like isoform X1 [Acipenser oxyrinchus oxyrinchus]|uniref:Zinc finger protein 19-like isoform X1 n=1 Tax=Acipenser oxyrinchus oxyrinchus TaxID=40147 RepID=A0AAD8CJR0_ACIOX|nr:zinc finger protein 19-like isoform X1 [Acipenser oxyrinchus oxyrinchus]